MKNDKKILSKSIKMINSQNIAESEKEKRIEEVNEVLKERDIEKRYSLIYDKICDYLDDEFRSNNVCGFKDNLCSKRRNMIAKGIKKDTYENGCCHGYRDGKDCQHLKNGRCQIKNIACKLFTCPYLRKRGKKFSINKIYFARYFYNARQKFYMENTFFVDKDVVMKGILERM